MAKLRRAEEKDYKAIHEIWMQDHVIQWMSFAKMDTDNFRPLYDKLAQESDIYVLEDGNNMVVGVRRIGFGQQPHNEHIAGFYSMGIHKDHLRKGYATQFYKEFMRIAAEHSSKITRIEFTQSYSNDGAFYLSDKHGFKPEAHFPEWLYRYRGDGGVYNLPERFVYMLLDKKVLNHVQNPDMSFSTTLPTLKHTSKATSHIKQSEHQYRCYDENKKLLGTFRFNPGPRVLKHILFLSVSIEKDADIETLAVRLRDIIMQAHKQGFKKIEVVGHDVRLPALLQQAGFHCRGVKQASIKSGDIYFNEVCADFSFFDIEDAKRLLPAIKDLDDFKRTQFATLLNKLQQAIHHELTQNQTIDAFGAMYLENLAFQMTRENVSAYPLYTSENAPWNKGADLNELPETLQGLFKNLLELVSHQQQNSNEISYKKATYEGDSSLFKQSP